MPTQKHVEPMDYGEIVPGVTCPECGGELVHSSNGAFCEDCTSYVPVVGSAVIVKDDESDDDWTDEEDVS
jgi:hypothetical protein